MQEMNKELQNQLWKEACCFIENSSRKHLAHFGVTLESADNQYLELAFTCPCNDEGYDDFLSIIDIDFLQVVRFEYPAVRIQEFHSDIALQVNYDRYEWEHIVQLSVGTVETAVFNKFSYWKRNHDKMTAGFRRSSKEFDIIYLQSLKKLAKQIDAEYYYNGDDIYEEMTIMEGAIEEKLGGELE
ncbi:hypothetical protein [Methanobrevibacter thaueri]|uniref:Uncharacterized protein n=1 Tax=Methanobrevibacter thaueri TaxID=190975 RepID=A0A315XPR5_9EURY|nr:hypothetical protein [Methanobrevibacter thaueri]PWB87874.1 hypothetical protein MBBTH_04610 [Methanobrevibacter thaueri]